MTVSTQSTIFDILYTLKHQPDLAVLAPMVAHWLGETIVNLVTFQWAGWLVRLPAVRPDLADAVLHGCNLPDRLGEGGGAGLLTIDHLQPTLGLSKFSLGVLNSPALVIPISTTSVFCFRWLALEGLVAGGLAFLVAFLANWMLMACALLGLDEVVARWYFLTPYTYVFVVGFMLRLVWKWSLRGPNFDLRNPTPWNLRPQRWRLIKTLLSVFALSLCEQTVLFQNIAKPMAPYQFSILHGFNSDTAREYFIMHSSYAAGLLVGGLLLTGLAVAIAFVLVSNPPLFELPWNSITTWALVMMTSVSVPYYALEYLAFRPFDLPIEGKWDETVRFGAKNYVGVPFSRGFHSKNAKELQVTLHPKHERPQYAYIMLHMDKAWSMKMVRYDNPRRSGLFRFMPLPSRVAAYKRYRSMWAQTRENVREATQMNDLDWIARGFFAPPTDDQSEMLRVRRSLRKYIAEHRARVARLADVPVAVFAKDKQGTLHQVVQRVPLAKEDPVGTDWFTGSQLGPGETHIKDLLKWGMDGPVGGTLDLTEPLRPREPDMLLDQDPDEELDLNLERSPDHPYLLGRFFKARWASHQPFWRLAQLEVDALMRRQPNRYFVTDSELKRLEYHRAMLACYHRSLRAYKDSIFVGLLNEAGAMPNADPDKLMLEGWKGGLRAKSLENYVYAQQFKGNQRLVARMFFRSEDWADNQSDEPIFRFDQLLPLEDEDRGERSPLWHVDFPSELRERVGADDFYEANRVSPMFDPVPFYVAWDPGLRKSVLTTSRLPYGQGRVQVELPEKAAAGHDWLGIKRFLEETKLYENLDLRAGEGDELLVPVLNPAANYHMRPSSFRKSPRAGAILTPNVRFDMAPDVMGAYEQQVEERRKIILGIKEGGPAKVAPLDDDELGSLTQEYDRLLAPGAAAKPELAQATDGQAEPERGGKKKKKKKARAAEEATLAEREKRD